MSESPEPELQQLTLSILAQRCAVESDRFFNQQAYDPRYCFELFRRALVFRDDMAWQLVFAQYRPLVVSWVERQPVFPFTGEEAEYFVNGAFTRLMKAIGPQDFERFANLRSILGYLQLCVASEVHDFGRSLKETVPLDKVDFLADIAPDDVEEEAAERSSRDTIWQAVRANMNDEAEFLVIYASYVLGLKPRQLLKKYPDHFPSVQRIYRIKENVLARLRRDQRIQDFYDQAT
jgi:hypothetical protein